VGHVETNGLPKRAEQIDLSVEVAQSGLYSTARDMGRWLQFLLNEGEADGERLLAASRLHESWTPNAVLRYPGSAGNPEIRANGLGWMIWSRHGSRWLKHAGGGVGHSTELVLLPDNGVGVAVLCNRSLSPIPDLLSTRVLYEALGERFEYPRERALAMVQRMIDRRRAIKVAMLEERQEGAAPPLSLASYVGVYSDELYGEVKVELAGDSLAFHFHEIPLEVTHLHDQVFLLWSPLFDGWRAEFESQVEGAVGVLKLPMGPAGGMIRFLREH
jgi:hypothetical protein